MCIVFCRFQLNVKQWKVDLTCSSPTCSSSSSKLSYFSSKTQMLSWFSFTWRRIPAILVNVSKGWTTLAMKSLTFQSLYLSIEMFYVLIFTLCVIGKYIHCKWLLNKHVICIFLWLFGTDFNTPWITHFMMKATELAAARMITRLTVLFGDYLVTHNLNKHFHNCFIWKRLIVTLTRDANAPPSVQNVKQQHPLAGSTKTSPLDLHISPGLFNKDDLL